MLSVIRIRTFVHRKNVYSMSLYARKKNVHRRAWEYVLVKKLVAAFIDVNVR
jgi:hypothetical protein